MTITTVDEFIETVRRVTEGDDQSGIYRGQANYLWRVDCSAVRRLTTFADGKLDPALLVHPLIGYLSTLIGNARDYVGTCPELPYGCSDLDILAQLQHQGAATGLIDFTFNPLVALWFACVGHPDKDGAVFVLLKKDTQDVDENEIKQRVSMGYFYGSHTLVIDWKQLPYIWAPTPRSKYTSRPASQQSLFVVGMPFIWPSLLAKIIIDRASKKNLLAELQEIYGISGASLFPDFNGFAYINSEAKHLDLATTLEFWEGATGAADPQEEGRARSELGLAHAAIGDLDDALAQFTLALAAIPDHLVNIGNRAKVKRQMGDMAGAIEDYDLMVEICQQSTEENASQMMGRVLWSRGTAYEALGEARGIEDMNRAIELGYTVYHHSTGEGEVRIKYHPPSAEEYRIVEGHTDPNPQAEGPV